MTHLIEVSFVREWLIWSESDLFEHSSWTKEWSTWFKSPFSRSDILGCISRTKEWSAWMRSPFPKSDIVEYISRIKEWSVWMRSSFPEIGSFEWISSTKDWPDCESFSFPENDYPNQSSLWARMRSSIFLTALREKPKSISSELMTGDFHSVIRRNRPSTTLISSNNLDYYVKILNFI